MFKNVILLNIFFIKIDFYSEKLFHVFYLQPHQLHSSQLVEPIVPMGYSFYWTITIVFHQLYIYIYIYIYITTITGERLVIIF